MRRPDWEERLHAYANAKNGQAFRWGRTDCGSLVRGAVKETHTGNPLGRITAYRTRQQATQTLDGLSSPGARLEEVGAARVHSGLRQCGDVLVLPGHDGHGLPRLGVMLNGGKVLTSLPGHGVYLGTLELEDAEVWRLPWE